MTKEKILPVGFLAIAVTLSGMTIATAQSTNDTPDGAIVTEQGADTAHEARDNRRGRDGQRGLFRLISADSNEDGTITMEEIVTAQDAFFAAADVNGDSVLSLEELEATMPNQPNDRLSKRFERLDANADGQVSYDELGVAVTKISDRLDRNDDGVINADDRGERNARGDRNGGRNRDRS